MRALVLLVAILASVGCVELDLLPSTQGPPPPPAVGLEAILASADNASVATEPARVVAIQNATPKSGQGSWKVPSLVTVENANGTRLPILLDTANTTQHRKQLGVPTLGMRIQAQGRVARNATGAVLLKNVTRWAALDHEGSTQPPELVAAGALTEGSWVWLERASVQRVRHESDGDYHVELAIPGGKLVTEETPPFADNLDHPNAGDEVEAYGMVLFDATHGWWELHPVVCWSRARCAPPLAAVGDVVAGED